MTSSKQDTHYLNYNLKTTNRGGSCKTRHPISELLPENHQSRVKLISHGSTLQVKPCKPTLVPSELRHPQNKTPTIWIITLKTTNREGSWYHMVAHYTALQVKPCKLTIVPSELRHRKKVIIEHQQINILTNKKTTLDRCISLSPYQKID